MTFYEAVQEAKKLAVEEFKLYYVFEMPDGFHVSPNYRRHWLYRAYPGGRFELSKAGVEYLGQQGVSL